MSNLWDEDDDNSQFLDRPDETRVDNNRQPMQAPPVQIQQPQRPRPSNIPAEPVPAAQEQSAHFEGDIDLDIYEDEDFSEVLNDANLRIEQGRLYQMVMNHELFEGMEIDPRAVKNVQTEIRRFARERMEVMLGMRKETSKVETLEIDFPFNALEVEVLKKLAFTATKGATRDSDNFVPAIKRVTEEVPVAPRRTTLNPIGNTQSKKTTTQRLPSKATSPIKRKRLDATTEQILAEEGVSRELIEEDYVPIGKPLNQLTSQELEKRARETQQRLAQRKTVKSTSALPMATPEQQELMAIQRANQMGSAPGMAALLEKVKNMPIKQE